RRSFSFREHTSGLLQRALQDRRLRALIRIQVLVPRAARESVPFPHRRYTDDFNRKIQVSHHSPNDNELLKILFAKDRGVRRQQMEQLRHDSADAAEMSRSGPAFEGFRKRILVD